MKRDRGASRFPQGDNSHARLFALAKAHLPTARTTRPAREWACQLQAPSAGQDVHNSSLKLGAQTEVDAGPPETEAISQKHGTSHSTLLTSLSGTWRARGPCTLVVGRVYFGCAGGDVLSEGRRTLQLTAAVPFCPVLSWRRCREGDQRWVRCWRRSVLGHESQKKYSGIVYGTRAWNYQ